MLVTHIKLPRPLDISSVKKYKECFENIDLEYIKIFYDHFCNSRFPYKESDFDLNEIEKDEIYLVDNKESILKKRYVRSLFLEGIDKILSPLLIYRDSYDLGEDIFCINLDDSFVVGCAENMRYVNRDVYHRNHLILLTIKMVCRL